MEVYVGGRRISLDPTKSIGKGGEADVYLISADKALKVFKPPTHPDLEGLPDEQKVARLRIEEHQTKLREFPNNLPTRIVVPEELATNRSGDKVVGYVMRFLKGAEVLYRYTERSFRQQGGVSQDAVASVFRDLYATVSEAHKVKIVVGDFNDLNVLVIGAEAYPIDADSFQFGQYFCKVFTARFVDPLLCDPKSTSPMLQKPHSPTSDWYAFAVMLFQCLLFVDPYGGLYRPKDQAKQIPHTARPLHRITVFNPEVRYPKPAVPYGVLPDDLLQQFHLIFEKDWRGVFPIQLLAMRWTVCTKCGTEHARSVCPTCKEAAPAAVKEVTVVRGNVTATRIFRTNGIILFAAYQGGELRWLYHENGQFKREDGTTVLSGDLDPQMRFRLRSEATLIGKDGQLVALQPGNSPERIAVDQYGMLPIFDANERFRYWTQSGQLLRDGQLGPEYIGDVLAGQTLFWVGAKFGFGFYRAGTLCVAFVFDAERRGINDNVKLSPIRGQLVDSTCFFAKDQCWFFTATREAGKTVNRSTVIKADGTIVAEAESEEGDGSWLSDIRGKCAFGNSLLAATDDGIVRVEIDNGKIVVTKEFPDTEPFVSSGVHLFPGTQGLHVVSRQEISVLKIS